MNVPISEMKLKIKKFHHWLSGNHHHNLQKRLLSDDKEAQKEMARLLKAKQ